MELLGGIKKKTEQRKAYKFYQQMPKLQGHPRELRKLRSLMNSRLTAFIDTTFIEGAKKTESLQDAHKPVSSLKLESSPYKEVKTLGGVVYVYLPAKYSNYFFELGSLYQRALLTINQVLELADNISSEISGSLRLDRTIYPLNFLRPAEPDTGNNEDPTAGEEDVEPTDTN